MGEKRVNSRRLRRAPAHSIASSLNCTYIHFIWTIPKPTLINHPNKAPKGTQNFKRYICSKYYTSHNHSIAIFKKVPHQKPILNLLLCHYPPQFGFHLGTITSSIVERLPASFLTSHSSSLLLPCHQKYTKSETGPITHNLFVNWCQISICSKCKLCHSGAATGQRAVLQNIFHQNFNRDPSNYN